MSNNSEKYHLTQSIFYILLISFLISSPITQIRGEALLDNLLIDFGSPSATLPLDRFLKHRFTVKFVGDKPIIVDFRIHIKDTNQEIVGWPQPQVLYLDPNEEKTVQTFLDEKWGRVDRKTIGYHKREVEWTFRDRETQEEKKYVLTYRFTVLGEDKITGDLKIVGRVINKSKKTISNAIVMLSTGPGGWSTRTVTESDGTFSFPGVPKRDDWVLEAAIEKSPIRAITFVEPNKRYYTLTLKEPSLKVSYQITTTERTEIGFWKGDVDSTEKYVLLINGMENWRDPTLKSKSKLYLYTLDGELKWAYDMGWEGWGASLSRDGRYAAFVTSNHTKTIGLINVNTGKHIWLKKAEEFKEAQYPAIDSKEIKISNANKYIGIGSTGGSLFILELGSGKVLWTKFLKGQIRGIAFDKNDRFVYAGSGDGNAYKLEIENGSIIWKSDIGSWPFVSSFKLSPDESLLSAGGKMGEVTILQTNNGKRIWQSDQLGAVSWLDFSPDGKYLIAGGGGQGATTLYETETGKKLWRIGIFSHQGKFSSDGKFILIGDRNLKIVDLNGNEFGDIVAPDDQSKQVGQGQFTYISKDGKRIIYTRRDIDPRAVGIIFTKIDLQNKGAVEH